MASSNATFNDASVAGALLAPVKAMAYVVLIMTALLIAAWLLDWIYVFKLQPNTLTKLSVLLQDELDGIGDIVGFDSGLNDFAVAIANALFDLVFKATGILHMGWRFAEGQPLSIPDTIARNVYLENYGTIQVAMIGTQLFGVRLAMTLSALPLLGTAYAAATADGLIQRAIRRKSAANESSSVYHRAKYLQVGLVSLAIGLYLALPVSIDPHCVFLPTTIVLILLARVQWCFYKKHL